jgi:hypothetical protein
VISSADIKMDSPQTPHPASTAVKAAVSGAPWIEDAGVPLWRKLAGKVLVALAWLLGAAVLTIYVYIIWSDPPDFSRLSASREFKDGELFYLILPLLFAFGPVWAAGWLAKRIDPSRPDDVSDD